ncbi:MAG: hypothetical protein ABIY55_23590 [Kofleriaceae bacterium]
MRRRSVFLLAVAACSRPAEPPPSPRVAAGPSDGAVTPAAPADRPAPPADRAAPPADRALPADRATAPSKGEPAAGHEPTTRIATWSSQRTGLERAPSPACITASDRFVQYADLDGHGAPRFCLWWSLAAVAPEVGCWRVELATGTYVAEGGVWFSTPQPPRVGTGGPALPSSPLTAHWRDAGLDICRGPDCRRFPYPPPPDRHDEDVAIDAAGSLAVVPLADPPSAGTRDFATVELASGARLATLHLRDRGNLEIAGFIGSSLMVTDCDLAPNAACVWDLYDPRRGIRLAAVGGAKPLGSGGTAALVDAQHVAAVAGHALVIQDLATGQVTATLALPGTLRADYVVFPAPGGVLALGPDGRVVLVDPAGKITRTIAPPRCAR